MAIRGPARLRPLHPHIGEVARRLPRGSLCQAAQGAFRARASFVTQAGSPGLVPVSENPAQGTRSSAAAIESDVERAEAQRKADLKRR